MRSAVLCWYTLAWPREVTPEQVTAALRLLASSGGSPLVLEAVGAGGLVTHRLAVPAPQSESVSAQLAAGLPGLSLEADKTRPPLPVRRAVSLRLSTNQRPLGGELADIGRALLTALAQTHKKEQLCVQWLLTRRLPAQAVPNRVTGLGRESWLSALLLAPFSAPPPADSERRSALSAKQAEAGWQAIGRLGVRSGSPARERQLIGQLLGALRTSNAPGVQWWARATNPDRLSQVKLDWRPPLRLNARELALICCWPVGDTAELPVKRLTSRRLASAAAIPREGLVLGEATYPGRERPLAITPNDARRHLHILGPTGVGKSTLLAKLILQAAAAGQSVVAIETRGDLIEDVLTRLPAARHGEVVLLDPRDESPIGLNPLSPGGRSPELVADQVLGLFHSLYAENWGIRTQDILGAALVTLARTPGMTLAALLPLLMDAGFRRRIVGRLADDPLGLTAFWRSFESWRDGERLQAITPVITKLRPILLRPDIRAIVGQARPRFELRQVFTEHKLLLVNLASGQVGPETAALLGSLVIGQLWQAIQERSSLPRDQRQPVLIVLDEFQTYLQLPVDLSEALVQARGLGAGWVLAHQFLHQLPTAMRAAVLSNAQSKLAFRLEHDDARVMAAGGSLLTPEDFQGLSAFEAYAQMMSQGSVQPWCSLRTLPLGEATTPAEDVRRASRERYGVARAETEAALAALVNPGRQAAGDDLRPKRRRPHPEATS